MAISKIQYDDKVAINIDSTIPDINKCNASDLNEIKSVVNNNADEIPEISNEYGTSTKDGYSQNYINENTINPSGEPSTSEEDVSSATFTNTLEAPMNIDLKGNTLQNGTPTPSSPIPINNVSGDNDINVVGKNLFNANASVYSFPASSATTTTTGTIYLVANTKYYITYNVDVAQTSNTRNTPLLTLSGTNYYQYTIANQNLTVGRKVWEFTPQTSGTYTLNYWVQGSNVAITISNIMISTSSDTTYEAYNGTTYNIDLPVENLIPNNLADGSLNNVSWVVNSDGSISLSGTANARTEPYLYNNSSSPIKFKAGTYINTSSLIIIIRAGSYYSFSPNTPTTINNDISATEIYFRIENGTTTNYTYYPQLLYGSKANTYTPYGTTPIELNKIGTYQDYIYKENDKWYLHKETKKLDMSTIIDWVKTDDGSFFKSGFVDTYGIKRDTLLSNIFQYSTENWYDNGYFGIASSGNMWVKTGDSSLTTATAFTNWLSNKGAIMYGILTTPTNTEITYTPLIEQLESIKNAMSKEDTTNVNQVNNDAPFMLDLSVFNDNYNGRYESLVEQIPNNDNLVNIGTYVNDNYKVNMLYSHNLFDKNNANVLNAYIGTANGTIAALNNGRTIWIPIEANTTYTISKLKSARFVIATYTTQPALNVSGTNVAYDNDATSLTITSGTNDKYLAVWLFNGDVDTLTYQQIIDSLMINEGSEALPYEPYIVPSINIDGEEIYNANLMNYSTNEQVIGKWIDGKPLYRKVIDFGALPNNSANSKAHNISNLATFTNMRGYCTNGTDWRTIPFASAINTISDIQVSCDATYIYTRTNTNMSFYNAFIVLEYTKTTD